MSTTNSLTERQVTMNSLIQEQLKSHEIKIYDSMNAQKRTFKPLVEGKVGMYVCGMTIYDYSHIGHAKVGIVYDMVARWLRCLGYEVTYVRNITDIDDKIINRAQEKGQDIQELTEHFINIMHEDLKALGCETPTVEPRATEYIDEMLAMIGTLEEKKHAYAATNGDVYYAVDTFKDYGKLSKRNLEELQAGSRVEVDADKRNPFDFVLWKAAKPNEPQWSSNWGNGRPGWHIECSAMATKILGNSFDIHGGGHDLQFPHHENEIAQSEAATGCTYSNYWMHVGFINVDGEKMSKSLGNFFTIKEIRRKFHPEVIRFFILSSHYRSQVNFSDVVLQEAHAGLTRIYLALKAADAVLALDPQRLNDAKVTNDNSAAYAQYIQDFVLAMNDDFNTPIALSVLFNLTKEINKLARVSEDSDEAINANLMMLSELTELLRALSAIINIGQLNPIEFLQTQIGQVDDTHLTDDKINQLIQERLDARANKDFARADEVRDLLLSHKIELEDGKQLTTWRRL